MKVEGADCTVNEIRPFLPPINHRHPQVGTGNGKDKPGDARTSAEINNGPHIVRHRRHERLSVGNDLGNRPSTEHPDALRLT
jgi:hypothetical protein